MNWLDLIIIICIGVAVIKGLFDGFIKQVVSLIALALGILFAGGIAGILQPYAEKLSFIPSYLTYPVCYIVSFILIFIVMGLLSRLLEKIWNYTPFGCLNNLAGGFIGAVISIFFLSLIFNFLIIFDSESHLIKEQTKKESALFEKVRSVVPTLYPFIKNKIEEGFKNYPFEQKEENPVLKEKEELEQQEKSIKKKTKDIFEV